MTLTDKTTTITTLEPMTEAEARSITHRIIADLDALWPLVSEAYHRRAWAVLGYDSWEAYTTEEFGSNQLRLPTGKRLEVVQELSASGMSVRAIAAATGASKSQVSKDVQVSSNGQVTTTVTGTDGKTYTRHPRPEPAPEALPTTKAELDSLPTTKAAISVVGAPGTIQVGEREFPVLVTAADSAEMDWEPDSVTRVAAQAYVRRTLPPKKEAKARAEWEAVESSFRSTLGREMLDYWLPVYLSVEDELDGFLGEQDGLCVTEWTASGRDVALAQLDALSARIEGIRSAVAVLQ